MVLGAHWFVTAALATGWSAPHTIALRPDGRAFVAWTDGNRRFGALGTAGTTDLDPAESIAGADHVTGADADFDAHGRPIAAWITEPPGSRPLLQTSHRVFR